MGKTYRYEPEWHKEAGWHRYVHRIKIGGGKQDLKSWFFRNRKWFKKFEGNHLGFHRTRSQEIWF